MKQKNIFIALALLLFCSCDKFLDIQPKGEVIPTTLRDYDYLLSNPVVFSTTSNFPVYMTDEITLPEENRGDLSVVGVHAVRAYDFKPLIFEFEEPDADWENAYKLIYTCNTILEGVDNAPTGDGVNEDSRKRIKGEALVHRAFAFLQLVNAYAKHYDAATASSDLGVPMPLSPDINALLARASVQEVYDQIEKDLLASIDLLPQKPKYLYKPSQAAAHGALARMYLYKGDYEKAASFAQKALDYNSFIFNYNEYTEWKDPFDKNSGLAKLSSEITDYKNVIFHKYLNKVVSYGFTFLLSPEQKALYKEGDLRLELGTTDTDWYGEPVNGLAILFTNVLIGNADFAGIQTNEMMLIRAECNARKGDVEKAMSDINLIREKRFKPENFAPLTASNKTEALDLVFEERRLELAFTGLRLFDIKRLNKEGYNIVVKHGDIELSTKDNRLVMPIANNVVSRNTNIKQNPR